MACETQAGLWDQGVSPHFCDTFGNPPFYEQNSLWEALSVVSQKWSFPTALNTRACVLFSFLGWIEWEAHFGGSDSYFETKPSPVPTWAQPLVSHPSTHSFPIPFLSGLFSDLMLKVATSRLVATTFDQLKQLQTQGTGLPFLEPTAWVNRIGEALRLRFLHSDAQWPWEKNESASFPGWFTWTGEPLPQLTG